MEDFSTGQSEVTCVGKAKFVNFCYGQMFACQLDQPVARKNGSLATGHDCKTDLFIQNLYPTF